VIRGINGQQIFEDDEDYAKFIENLSKVKKQAAFELFAYCLMSNHVHLLIREGSESVSLLFKRLGVSYVLWFNHKYGRSGHLFQGRFKSEPVEDDGYLLQVLLYIYQNPVKAGICKAPQDYFRSSRRLLGKGGGLVDEAALLEIIPLEVIKQRERFLVDEQLPEEARVTLVRHSDSEAMALLRSVAGVDSTTAFQMLGREARKAGIRALREMNVPIRQISRITGFSKGSIEHTCKARGKK
jgi:REP element-mobilizing transposase RayT